MAETQVRAVLETVDNMSGPARQAAGAIGGLNLKAIAASAAIAGIAKAGYEFAKSGIRFNAEVETSTLRFGRFFENAKQAEDHVKSLTAFAASTPFQLAGITEASQHLFTFGGHALATDENLRLVGDAAAAVNMPIQDVGMWVGRMYSSLEAGRPIGEAAMRLQEMGLLSGEARNRLEDLAKEGAGATAGMEALRDILSDTSGGMEALSLTTSGLESTTSDLYQQVSGAFIEASGMGDLYRSTLTTLNSTLTDTIVYLGGEGAGGLVAGLGAVGIAATGAIGYLGQIGPSLAGILPLLPKMAGLFKLLWLAITGPVGLVVTAVAAVGTAFYVFRGQIGDVLSNVIDFVATWADNFIGRLQSAVSWIPGVGDTLDEFIEGARGALRSGSNAVADYVDSWGEVPPAVEPTVPAVEDVVASMGQGGETGGPTLVGSLAATGEAAAKTTEEVKLLTSGITALDDRIKASRKETRNAINDLIGSQGLTSGFQQAAAGATLASSSIGVSMMETLPNAVETGVTETLGHFNEGGTEAAKEWKAGFDEVVSADNIFGTIARAFEGGGDWRGGVKSIGAQMGGSLIEGLQSGSLGTLPGVFGSIGGKIQGIWSGISGAVSAIPFAGPILAAFGPQILKGLGAIGKKVWGAIKGMFGPSEAELTGRRFFDGFRTGAQVPMDLMEEYNRQVAEAVNAGWDRNLAEVRAKFVTVGMAAGLSAEEAFNAYARYQQAVGDGNTELMRQLEEQYGEWVRTVEGAAEEASGAVQESTDDIVHSAEEIGNQFKGLTEDEARKLGVALEWLGNAAHRGFSLVHSSALAAGNALADRTLPAVRDIRKALEDAAEAAGNLGRKLGGIPTEIGVNVNVSRTGADLPQAQGGGVFRGPATGYPVMLHGTETVVPGAHPGLVAGGGGITINLSVSGADVIDSRRFADRVVDELIPAIRRKGGRV